MRKTIGLLLFCVLTAAAMAQSSNGPRGAGGVIYSAGTPVSCSVGTLIIDTTTTPGTVYWCNAGTPTAIAAVAGSVNFSAIGAGTNTNALVEGTGGSLTYSSTGTIDANKLAHTAITGVTGTGNAVLSASPTLTGTITAAIANFSGLVSANNGLTVASGKNLTLTGVSDGCATFASGVLGSTGSACGSGGGLADPGANGIVYRNALNTTAPATVGNLLSTYGSSLGSCALGNQGGAIGAVSLAACKVITMTLTSNVTSLSISNANNTQYTVKITQDGTGGRTVSGVTTINNFPAIVLDASKTTEFEMTCTTATSCDVIPATNTAGYNYGQPGTAFSFNSSTVPSGYFAQWVDPTNKVPTFQNDAQSIATYIFGIANPSDNKFVSYVPLSTGVPVRAQPLFANLGGGTAHGVTIAQATTVAPNFVVLGAHATLIGAASADPSGKTIPDCTDTGGNHLNFTQSTDAFSCGTSGGSGGAGGTITYSTVAAVLAGTSYFSPGGGNPANATEASVQVAASAATTLSGLQVQLGATPTSGNIVFTVRSCTPTSGACTGSDSVLTCTISNPAVACADNTHSFNISKGDLISVKAVVSSVAASSTLMAQMAWGTTNVGITGTGAANQVSYWNGTNTQTGLAVPSSNNPKMLVQATGAAPYFQLPINAGSGPIGSNARVLNLYIAAATTTYGDMASSNSSDNSASGSCTNNTNGCYIVPTGKVACAVAYQFYNGTSVNDGVFDDSAPATGTFTPVVFRSSVTSAANAMGYCAAAGHAFAGWTSASGPTNAWVQVVEMDATSGIYTTALAGCASGPCTKVTLYTPPAGVHAWPLTTSLTGTGNGSLACVNAGSTAETVTFYINDPSTGGDAQITAAISAGTTTTTGTAFNVGLYGSSSTAKLTYSATNTAANFSCYVTWGEDSGTH